LGYGIKMPCRILKNLAYGKNKHLTTLDLPKSVIKSDKKHNKKVFISYPTPG